MSIFPHFRRYKPSKHRPALVEGETKNHDEYVFRKCTHKERNNRHINEKVVPNPDPHDPKPMYIQKKRLHDVKTNFDKKKLPWKYPKTKSGVSTAFDLRNQRTESSAILPRKAHADNRNLSRKPPTVKTQKRMSTSRIGARAKTKGGNK